MRASPKYRLSTARVAEVTRRSQERQQEPILSLVKLSIWRPSSLEVLGSVEGAWCKAEDRVEGGSRCGRSGGGEDGRGDAGPAGPAGSLVGGEWWNVGQHFGMNTSMKASSAYIIKLVMVHQFYSSLTSNR